MKLTKQWGMIALAVYLLLVGIMSIVSLPIPAIVVGIVAIAAGVLILINR